MTKQLSSLKIFLTLLKVFQAQKIGKLNTKKMTKNGVKNIATGFSLQKKKLKKMRLKNQKKKKRKRK